MAKYTKKQLVDDVMNGVAAETLIQPKESMIMYPQLIGSYYKNGKQVRNIAYWMDVLNRKDAEALSQLKQA